MHHNVIIKDGDTTKYVKKVLVDGVQFVDDAPIKGSSNLVSSNGVAKAIADTKEAVDEETADLQQQIDDIAEKAGSGYVPKGEATVATLNGLSVQDNGDLYTMTDAGTLTDGSLAVVAGDTVAWDATNEVWYKAMDYAPRQYGTNEVHNLPTTITAFRTGDVIPVDGPSGTTKMGKDDLLRVTAENAQSDKNNVPYDKVWGYVKNDGTFVPGAEGGTYISSDFIPVNGGDVLSIGYSGSSSVLGISGYSSDDQSTYVSGFKWAGEGGYSRKEITIPSGVAYIRVSFNTLFSGDYHVYKQTELSKLPKAVEKEITNIKEMKGDAVPYSVNVGYVKNDGTIVDQLLPSTYRYSDFIAVEEGVTYSVAFSGSASVLGLSGYATADQSDIVSSFEFLGENDCTRYAVKIPSGVHYIRITYNLYYDGDYTMYAPNGLTALKESVDKLSLGVNVSYEENLKKYAPITPKKACIMFEMDCNANGVNTHLDEYADTLEEYGIKRSTFFPHSDLMDGSNPLYVSIMQRMQSRGNEVSIHSVASDGIGQTDTTPAPSLSQFETIMQGYVSGFEGVGLAPIGWVTSRGTIHSEFREPLRKWVAYGHTLANKTAYPNFNVSTYVNDTDTDRLNILRIGLEYSAGEGETQADVDAEMLQCAKDAVDYAVANGGLVCFYAHSYKTTTIPYTMRSEVLVPLLQYIKTNYIDKHLIVSGTGAEVCKYYFG